MRIKSGKGMWLGLGTAILSSLSLAGLSELEPVFGPWEPTGDSAYRSEWFGELDGRHYPWVAHEGLGWLYVLEQGDGSVWAHDAEAGWLYFGAGEGPWIYRLESGSWQYAHAGNLAGQGFHDAEGRNFWWGSTPLAGFAIELRKSLWRAEETLKAAALEVFIRTRYPSRTDPSTGRWNYVAASDWTSGFWPGCLWLMYDFTGDSGWEQLARSWTAGLEGQKTNTSTHDVGFMLFCSFGEGYRLTGDESYRQVLLQTAASLETRYNAQVGGYRSWSWGKWDDGDNFTIIADNMMNLELMFWAGKQPGGLPQWGDHALTHGYTTMDEHLRPDDGSWHGVIFHQGTGEVLQKSTHQGLSDSSTWARGQAWLLYGFTMSHEETGDAAMLEAAIRTADYFIRHLPADGIPPWDFDVPDPEGAARDSSAAAIAASALLRLSQMVSGEPALHYRETALGILKSLISPAYQNGETSALLDHGTAHFPAGSFDTGLIWGDYYFLEALLRSLDLFEN